MSSEPTDLIREATEAVDEQVAYDVFDLVRRLRDALEAELCPTCGGSGIQGWPPDDYYDCPECVSGPRRVERERDEARAALAEERAYSAHLKDEVTRAKEWQGINVATRFMEFQEAQRWAAWFAAERDQQVGATKLAMTSLNNALDVLAKASGLPEEATEDTDLLYETVLALRPGRDEARETADRFREGLGETKADLAEANATIAALRVREETVGHIAESERFRAIEATRELVQAREVIAACRPAVEWAKTATVDIDGAWGLSRTFEQLLTDAEGNVRDGYAVAAQQVQCALDALDSDRRAALDALAAEPADPPTEGFIRRAIEGEQP